MKVLQISKKDSKKLGELDRKSVEIKSTYSKKDDDFCYGAFIDGKLISSASFHLEKNPLIPDENQFCINEIINTDDNQPEESTKELLKTIFPIMRRNFTKVVWCKTTPQYQGIFKDLDFKPLKTSTDSQGTQEIVMIKNL